MDTTAVEGAPSEQPKRPIVRPRTRSRYTLPSERFPFENHFEVLRQFVVRTKHGAESVSAKSVEGGTLPRQAAALNVKFLCSIGLLKEDENAKNRYLPTEIAGKFVSTRSASEDKARPILRSVVESSWFGDFTRNWFATRAVAPEDEFVRELAIYAEVSDMSKKEQALRIVVAYLTHTGLVAKDNGNLVWGTSPATQSLPSPGSQAPTPPTVAAREPRPRPDFPGVESPADWHTVQTDDFYLKVRSDPEVLADLRAHIDLLEKKVARLRART